MAQTKDNGRLWLGLSTTTEIATAITLNKYSAVLPGYAVLLIWLIPLALLLFWVMKEEKSQAFTKHFRETPVSYCLMFLVAVPVVSYTTHTVWEKINFVDTAQVSSTTPKTPTLPTLRPAKPVSTPPQSSNPKIIAVSPKPQRSRAKTTLLPASNAASDPAVAATDSSPQQTVNAPNGIGSIGGILINPQVNNIGYMQKNLTSDQILTLSQLMKPFATGADRGDLITCQMGDSNSCSLAQQLVTAFRSAGWNLTGSGLNQGLYSPAPEPLLIVVQSAKTLPSGHVDLSSLPPGALEIANSLTGFGVNVMFSIDEKVPTTEFKIVVGTHP